MPIMTIRHPSLTKEKVPFPCPEQTFVNMNLEIEKKNSDFKDFKSQNHTYKPQNTVIF